MIIVLIIVVGLEDFEMVKYFIKVGVDVNCIDEVGKLLFFLVF